MTGMRTRHSRTQRRPLGYVIVHELGHLLLPAPAHAVMGVMQPGVDVHLIRHNGVAFLPQQVTLIRARLAEWIGNTGTGGEAIRTMLQ